MHFPVAGIEISPIVPFLVAFSISAVTSTGGVSGAFLILPFQMSVLGFTSPAVSATYHLYNVVATPGGIAHLVREGRMLWPLAWTIVAGTVPGVLVGTVVRIRWLVEPRRFELFAGLVLLWVAGQTIHGLLRSGRPVVPAAGDGRSGDTGGDGEPGPQKARRKGVGGIPPAMDVGHGWRLSVTKATTREVEYRFRESSWSFRPRSVLTVSLAVGVVGGAWGIGGGAIVAPLVVTLFNLPVHTVAGAALLGTFVTSLAGVLFYHLLAPLHPGLAVAPDWALGVLFGLGGLLGTWCGAWVQPRIPDTAIRWMLAAVLVFVGVRYTVP